MSLGSYPDTFIGLFECNLQDHLLSLPSNFQATFESDGLHQAGGSAIPMVDLANCTHMCVRSDDDKHTG
eukprot:1125614-Rhodomonas_salina.2